MARRVKLEDRFWDNVLKSDGCWEWTAATNADGYGRIWADGEACGAHRVSWKLNSGDIPEGMHVLHSCDNPKCVRPDHLFLGDQQANSEMVAKGRSPNPKGSKHIRTKPLRKPIQVRFSEEEREMIESMANAWGVSIAQAVRRLVREAKEGVNGEAK